MRVARLKAAYWAGQPAVAVCVLRRIRCASWSNCRNGSMAPRRSSASRRARPVPGDQTAVAGRVPPGRRDPYAVSLLQHQSMRGRGAGECVEVVGTCRRADFVDVAHVAPFGQGEVVFVKCLERRRPVLTGCRAPQRGGCGACCQCELAGDHLLPDYVAHVSQSAEPGHTAITERAVSARIARIHHRDDIILIMRPVADPASGRSLRAVIAASLAQGMRRGPRPS